MDKLNKFRDRLIDTIYKNNDVSMGYFYWQAKLLDIVVDLFKWDGLPESIPEVEIEKRLFMTGHCGVVKHPKLGLIVCDSYLYDYDLYGRYLKADFFNPYREFNNNFIPGNKEIGKECEVIYNMSMEKYSINNTQTIAGMSPVYLNYLGYNNFMQTINRYARLLADLEATISIEIVQQRQLYVGIAPTQQIAEAFRNLFRNTKRGDITSIIDNDFLKDSKTLKMYDLVVGTMQEKIETRQSLIKYFLEEIGIYSTEDKKERLLVDELAQENRNTKPFIYSLLKERQEGADRVNKLYGTNWSVGLRSELYDTETELHDTEDVEEREEVEVDESSRVLTE